MNTICDQTLADARQLLQEEQFAGAIKKYFTYFFETSERLWDKESVKEFNNLIFDMDIFLSLESVSGEIWNTIRMSRSLFTDDWRFVNIMADAYYKYGCMQDFIEHALQGYQVAREQNVSCIAIEKKLLKAMWHNVPRWHFRMLNGKVRNTSYQRAIFRALENGYTTALDIGAGCGLLSLYLGTHCSKPTITLFESNKTLYDLALLNLKKYCPGTEVDSYMSDSNDVETIKYKSNLLVTEIFDVAVFGEGILSTLLHSLESHMISDNHCIIPAKVNIFVTGITSRGLNRKFRLHNKIPCFLNIDEKIYVFKKTEDPYDAENILSQDFDILTETTEVMELNFYEKEMLESIYKNEWKTNISLKGLKNGVIDCLVVWFDLHLDDEIVISTNPFHKQNEPCWEQAIFHCPLPLKIDKDEELSFAVNIIEEHLHFEVIEKKLESKYCLFFKLNEYSLSFLNDEKWTGYLMSLSEMITEKEQLTILDFSTFPMFGLLLAKKGHKVFYISKNQQDTEFLEYLININEIQPTLFNVVHHQIFPSFVLGQSKIDYVFYEPCDTDGTLNPSPVDNIIFKKFNIKSIFTDVILNFKLIFSPYLDYCNKVSEENVKPFEELAESINIFTGTEHPFLPHDFPYENMSNEQKWNMEQDTVKLLPLQISKDGKINGILTWFTLVGLGGIEYSTEKSTFFNLNALILPERTVESKDLLNIYCQYERKGNVKLEICKEEWVRTNFERYDMYNPSIEKFHSVYYSQYFHDSD